MVDVDGGWWMWMWMWTWTWTWMLDGGVGRPGSPLADICTFRERRCCLHFRPNTNTATATGKDAKTEENNKSKIKFACGCRFLGSPLYHYPLSTPRQYAHAQKEMVSKITKVI